MKKKNYLIFTLNLAMIKNNSINQVKGGSIGHSQAERSGFLKRPENLDPLELNRVKYEKEKILKHEFTILSHDINFSSKINWQTDFKGGSWPVLASAELNAEYLSDFNSPKYRNDIKLTWELSKHLHLQDLAKAYLVERDNKIAQEFVQEIDSWLKANPLGQGVNWTQGLIAAHRVISWVISWEVFSQSPIINLKFREKIIQSLYEHTIFVEETYEIGTRSSNHLLGELCAVIFVSIALPELKDTKIRLNRALDLLQDQLDQQIYTDGVQYEQSLSYHRVCLEFLQLILIIAKKRGFELPAKVAFHAEKMTEFLRHLTQPNGFYQPISDADGARVFVLGRDVLDARPYLALSAWLFNRADLKFTNEIPENIVWFLGREGQTEYQKIKPAKPLSLSKAFDRGGYWVSRTDWSGLADWLSFDCGPLGLGHWEEKFPIGMHGHSDTLNFGLALKGETFLTDLGSYSYSTKQNYHHFFRSARGHNAPILDNQDPNILSNIPWTLTPLAEGKNAKVYFSAVADYFSGEHHGYLRLREPVNCRRELLFLKNKKMLVIKDSFTGQGKHELEQNFHFAPEINIKIDHDSIIASGQNEKLIMKPFFSAETTILKASSDPIGGWYATNYGAKVPTSTIQIKTSFRAPGEFFYVLDWGKNNLDSEKTKDLFKKTYLELRKPKVAMLLTNDLEHDPRVQKEASSLSTNFDLQVFCFYLNGNKNFQTGNYGVCHLPYSPLSFSFNLKSKFKILVKRYAPRWSARLVRFKHQLLGAPRTKSSFAPEVSVEQLSKLAMAKIKKPFYKKIITGLRYYWQLNKKLSRAAISFAPDIVHAHDLDTLFAGYLIKRQTDAKLIYDAHEIWTEQSRHMPRLVSWIGKILEKFLLTKIDLFITVNPTVQKQLEKIHRLKIKKTQIVYNYPSVARPKKIKSSLKKQVVVLYQGRLAPDRGLEELIESAQYLPENIKIVIRATGDDNYRNRLTDLARKVSPGKISFPSPVEMNNLVQAAKSADLGVIFYRSTNLNNIAATPNKLYEYSAAGLALAVSDMPELERFVKRHKNGIVLRQRDPQYIAQNLVKILENRPALEIMKANSLKAAEFCRWEGEGDKLIKIYKNLI